jgi:hypothetical protein
MDTTIHLKVTPSQKETILLRMSENGFDDVSSYVKVVALKTQTVHLSAVGISTENLSEEIVIKLNDAQFEKIKQNMQTNECEDLQTYIIYIALHAVVSSVLEVRSTGSLDDILKRIADSRKK